MKVSESSRAVEIEDALPGRTVEAVFGQGGGRALGMSDLGQPGQLWEYLNPDDLRRFFHMSTEIVDHGLFPDVSFVDLYDAARPGLIPDELEKGELLHARGLLDVGRQGCDQVREGLFAGARGVSHPLDHRGDVLGQVLHEKLVGGEAECFGYPVNMVDPHNHPVV